MSSGRKCRTQFDFLLSIGGPAEPFDTTGGTLRFRGTPIEKQRCKVSFKKRLLSVCLSVCLSVRLSVRLSMGYGLWSLKQINEWRNKNATAGATTDGTGYIICSMLRHSSGTDNYACAKGDGWTKTVLHLLSSDFVPWRSHPGNCTSSAITIAVLLLQLGLCWIAEPHHIRYSISADSWMRCLGYRCCSSWIGDSRLHNVHRMLYDYCW